MKKMAEISRVYVVLFITFWLLNQKTAAQTYASIPFSESFENSWISRDGFKDVPSIYWKTDPNRAPVWLRDDYRTSAGAYNPRGANGSGHSARCYSSCCYPGYSNSLDLYLDFSTAQGNKYLSFWYINYSGTDSLKILLSNDGGITFGSPLTSMGIKLVWTKIIIDLSNVNTSIGVVRFMATTSNATLSDIGLDEVVVSDVVSDFASDELVGDAPLSVQFTDQSRGNPVSFQWDFDNDGRVDATTQNPSYTFTAPGTYTVKLKVSKPDSPGDSVVKPNYISVNSYSPLPFTESFENTWSNRNNFRDVPSNYWKNTPASGNDSWSRDDDGVARGAWSDSIYDGSYYPKGALGTFHSARFHSYTFNPILNESSFSGNLDIFIDFSARPGNKRLSFWYNNLSGKDTLLIYLSGDGSKSFGSPVMHLTTTVDWVREVLDLGDIGFSSGVIRFKATGLRNTSDIGLDEIRIDNLVADFTTNVSNKAFPLTVQFTDHSSGNPTSWKWDFNNDGTVDATSQNPTYTFDTLQTYSVKLVVSNGVSADSIIKVDAINAYAAIPFYEDFEQSWINRDDIRDVPSIYWKNTPATGNNSWSRDDDGSARDAWSKDYNTQNYGADGSSHSDCFNAFGNSQALTGKLDLHIYFASDEGNKILSFRYLNHPETAQHTPNINVTNTLSVYLSEDGGINFKECFFSGPVDDWSKEVISLGHVSTSMGIIRFEAYNRTWPITNIFIDDVKIYTQVPVYYASIPFSEDFGNQWQSYDSLYALVPSEYWSNPSNSWIPEIRSARYSPNSSEMYNGTGNLDLHVDFSTVAGKKSLSFDETIESGPLIVNLSVNGGVSFEEIYNSDNDNTPLSKNVIIDLDSISSPKGVIRFESLPESVFRQPSSFSIANLKIVAPDKNIDNQDDGLIKVFPSISDGTINVKFINFENEKLTCEVFNFSGKVLLSRSFNNYSIETSIQLDLTSFASGMYYIRTTCNGKAYLNKIIIE